MNKQKNNTPVLLSVIAVLVVIIGVLGFFLGKTTNTPQSLDTKSSKGGKVIKITVIDDKRCNNCQTDQIVSQLKLLPALSNASVEEKDFHDKGVEAYLKENNIKFLPAIIFESNQISTEIDQYLTQLPSEEYSLALGSSFDPFVERNEKGFRVLDQETLQNIKNTSFIKGNKDAQITWLEYSEIECPFCAKLHNNGTHESLTTKYGDQLNIIYKHFPLDFHENALPGAQILECLGEQKGGEAFYTLLKKSFSEKNSKQEFLIDEAVLLGAEKNELEKCLEEDRHKEKILSDQKEGTSLFGVTGTPGNVLINNNTLEYEIISGAQPTSAFEQVIDTLLGE